MITGNIYNDEDGKYIIDYKFLKLGSSEFITTCIDVSDCKSENDAISKVKLDNHFYKIVFQGVYHIDIKGLSNRLLEEYDNIIKVVDATTHSINVEEISNENSVRGEFAKLMMEELEKYPENANLIYEAIEHVLK